VEVSRLLCSEGYLIYDENTGTYSLTKEKDKVERLQKMKNDLANDARAAEMYSKIQDIMTLGKPLALSGIGKDTLVDIGIPGLNLIFGGVLQPTKVPALKSETTVKSPGLPRGHCILIKGSPGTGKTTLGMQIAIHLQDSKYRSLFLTFEEDIDQLYNNLNVYCRENISKEEKVGWDESLIKEVTRTISKIQIPSAWEDPEIVLQELISILDKELPQLVVIDSISRIKDIGGESKARPVLRRLIRTLKIRKITSIFLGESDGDRDSFEEYEVDGVIRLGWIGDQLTLTVDKMRGLKSFKGPHSAALLTVEDLKKNEHSIISEEEKYKDKYKNNPGASYLRPGFNVFPEISVYNMEMNGRDQEDETLPKALDTGIGGLNELLKFKGEKPDEKGFKQGEAILIIGSAGAGKTLMGLNFMIAGNANEEEVGVWISLEGAVGTLEAATAGFEEPWKQRYKDLYSLENTENKESKFFKFFNFPPLNLDLNKIIYTLEALQVRYDKIDRLVIDSITELERAKSGGQPEVKTFLAGLIQYLRDRGITTVFISRSETFFRSIDKIEEQVSSLVDLIICIRNFDMHNQIHKGIYIQKARGRIHNSKIMRMTIDSDKGIDIEDSGWDVENLLAGDSSNIQGPKVFFKLFYENPSETEVNEAIITDFDEKRYPGIDPKFTLVKKTSIYTEFWSFKGQYSSGHANTRVISIPDYVITAFRDNDRLAEIDKYVKWEVLQKIENEETSIKQYRRKKDVERNYAAFEEGESLSRRIIDAVPCYLDYGVMVYNKELIEENTEANQSLDDLRKWLKVNLKVNTSQNDFKWFNWDYGKKLIGLIRRINEKNEKHKPGIIPFALPPLDKESEFVAFFMELLWSYGGDIFRTDIREKKDEYEKKEKKDEKAFEKKIKNSIFKEFIHYCDCEVDIIKFVLRNKEKLSKPSQPYKILKNFEEKFFIYGLEQKGIKIQEFKEWIENSLEKDETIKAEKEESVLWLSGEPFKKAIKLMLRLVYRYGVKNPIAGEFRHRAILSRNWYSQIIPLKMEKCEQCFIPDQNCSDYSNPQREKCMKNLLKRISQKEKYHLLPLPLARNHFTEVGSPVYRSITCLTYWSLVMLKNALSPEIGGNFIESMNAPEYYEQRLKNKAGMPVTYLEIKKEKYHSFDPESYAILEKIFENDRINDEIVKEYKKDNLKGKIAELTKIKTKETKEREEEGKFENFAVISGDEFSKLISSLEDEEKTGVLELCKDEEHFNQRVFFSRLRQPRTAFYQLEEALHYQLKQLFIEDKRFREGKLYGGKDIVEEIEGICKKEKNGIKAGWNKCLKKIENEFRTHIIFELLVYFYKKNLRGEDKED
jgi:circadian clock protein KaiC